MHIQTPQSISGTYLNEDGELFDQIHLDDFPEHVFWEYFGRDPEMDDTRSQVVQIRFPNGDLFLGYAPQGDAYLEIEKYYT